MKKILRVDSSIFAQEGMSYQLANELINKLQSRYVDSDVVGRNLSESAVPHLDANWLKALSTSKNERNAEQQNMVAYSDALIAEIQNADIIVLAAPMYNFSVPSVMKAWFDHIARAGVTFRYTENGPEGLLKGKKLYLISTRGGMHKGKSSDTQIPFITTFLNFIGISDIDIIYAEGLNMSDLREEGLEQARKDIEMLTAA